MTDCRESQFDYETKRGGSIGISGSRPGKTIFDAVLNKSLWAVFNPQKLIIKVACGSDCPHMRVASQIHRI